MKHLKMLLVLSGMFACTDSLFSNPAYPAPTDIVQAYFAAVDAGNNTETAKLLADDCLVSNPLAPQPMPKQAWLGVVQGFKTAFPDLKHDIVAYTESGYTVVARGHLKGQNNGPLMGNPPTGNRVDCPFNAIFELDKSWKIKAIYSQFDLKTFEAQLAAGLPDPIAAAEATVRAMIAAADAGDVEKFMGFWAVDGVNYFAGKQTSGDDMKNRIAGMKAAFPDIHRTLDAVIVCGNSVTVRGWVSGTNKGMYQGQAPTGNAVQIAWLGLYQLNAEGKIKSGWVEFDTATLRSQVKGEMAGK